MLFLLKPASHTHDVGVDLGTGNTLVHVRGRGVVVNEPSVVAVRRSDRSVQAVGLEAKRMLGRTGTDMQAIRPLRDGVIADVDVAEAMLRRFLRLATPWRLRRPRPRLVVGVPSGITEMERRAVRSSGEASGATELFMVAEPIAAAIGIGEPVDTPAGVMVVDIGGGTTEIALIALGGIVADASIRIAGDVMDRAIVLHARRQHSLLIGDSTAEMVKIGLGSAVEEEPPRLMEVRGRHLVSGLPRAVVMNSTEIAGAIREPVEAIVAAVLRALELAPPEFAADIVERGIVLTGGGALLPGLPEVISRRTSVPVRVADDPLTCVVRGTAAILDDFERYKVVLRA